MESKNIEEAIQIAKNGKINLGTANGWSKETQDLYKFLFERKISETSKRNLGRCWNQYEFDVNLNGEIYQVIHDVDSGD